MVFMAQDEIRILFSRAMSAMYQQEVPAYGTLMELVKVTNDKFLADNPDIKNILEKTENINRIDEERHGAIRVGTPQELATIARLFAVMGMEPVSYYDLSVANIPVHSTAFRPVHRENLSVNPFRVFTSLLRLDLIQDEDLRKNAQAVLDNRTIFTDKCIAYIEQAEKDGGLNADDAQAFVTEALETFRWHTDALVDKDMYANLRGVHTLVADVVSFRGPHINHLTPRTLDIDTCQADMPKFNINPKAVVEGPPHRKNDILLRQTSFKALTENVMFKGEQAGDHLARFGEIEQRGVALTKKGRALYDALTLKVRESIVPQPDGSNATEYYAKLDEVFTEFPDDMQELHDGEYAYYEYHLRDGVTGHGCTTIDELIAKDLVIISPIVYEDFLPVSAAGIFQSNLGDDETQAIQQSPQQALFEQQLGRAVIDEFALYESIRQKSIEHCLSFA